MSITRTYEPHFTVKLLKNNAQPLIKFPLKAVVYPTRLGSQIAMPGTAMMTAIPIRNRITNGHVDL
ncbi:MAG: hypothetical protein P8L82_02135 [Paracoccaceae bacterium]|nr:hypothetical protein [Paracoccaceae bacterium]